MLTWPDVPACHAGEPHYRGLPDEWRQPHEAGPDEPYQETYRTCSYCGSMHPEDLYNYLCNLPRVPHADYRRPDSVTDLAQFETWKTGVDSAEQVWQGLDVADWKYGWPHKVYVKGIPNPIAGREIPIYTTSGDPDRLREHGEPEQVVIGGRSYWRVVSGRYPASATTTAKWYNRHLLDLDGEAFSAVAAELRRHTGINFHFDDEGRLAFGTGAW